MALRLQGPAVCSASPRFVVYQSFRNEVVGVSASFRLTDIGSERLLFSLAASQPRPSNAVFFSTSGPVRSEVLTSWTRHMEK
jgi:hypothetical protein